MNTDNDPLVQHLLELCRELDKDDISIILGGGMGLYLRLKFSPTQMPRYPFDPPVRSTADLDVFLSSHVIVNRQKIESLKASLLRLEYAVDPAAKNYHFIKKVKVFEQERIIKVDLLSAPTDEADKGKVKIVGQRIKPRGVDGIHGRLTDEATGIEIGKQPVDLTDLFPG